MNKQLDLFKRLPSTKQLVKNRYLLTLAVFLVYIAFFDHYSWIKQHQLNQALTDLKAEKAQFIEVIEHAEQLQRTIAADEEKFAREQYYMKRADEDVYIIK